jgi:uncharacterized membrane protein
MRLRVELFYGLFLMVVQTLVLLQTQQVQVEFGISLHVKRMNQTQVQVLELTL